MKRPQVVLSSAPALIEPDDYSSAFHQEIMPLTKRARKHYSTKKQPTKSSLDVLLKAIENVSPDLLDDVEHRHHHDYDNDGEDQQDRQQRDAHGQVLVDRVPLMTHEMDGPGGGGGTAASVATSCCDASQTTDVSHISHMNVGCLPPLTSFTSPFMKGRPLMAPPRLPSGLRPGQILMRRSSSQ